MNPRLALIVDAHGPLSARVAPLLAGREFRVQACRDVEGLRQALNSERPDLVVIDVESLDDPHDVIERLRRIAGVHVVAVVSGDGPPARLQEPGGLHVHHGTLAHPVEEAALDALIATLPPVPRRLGAEDLAAAIGTDQLHLVYQPKVAMGTGRVLSAEALVRWQHPERGTIFPDRFIPLAEESGLIVPMTDHILAMALAECRRWRLRGRPLSVAVNLSAASLTDLDLPNKVAGQLRAAEVEPDALILEVTETSAMTDPTATLDILTRLRIKGITVSLDDFGTGYSSLIELHRMPFSELKIDRSFVGAMDRDRDARIIVEAILSLAHALGLEAVAEGVETRRHWDLLTELRCDMAQGYLLSRPVPPEQFLAWVQNWRGTPLG